MEIGEHNIIEYLHSRTDLFNRREPIQVKEVISGNGSPENDGFVNFVFRISQGGRYYILKQARSYFQNRSLPTTMPVERNYLEYITYRLRKKITPAYVPQAFFVDTDNHVFLMEDMREGRARVMRYQLMEGMEFPLFPRQIGAFIARNHFYTSELYLEKPVFRELAQKFANPDMRAVMEDLVLLKRELTPEEKKNAVGLLGERVWENPAVRLAVLEVRDNFIRKGECLVHGDLHTSNLFVDQESLYVIDMEYSFMAPFSYDLGYLLANFTSQYAAFTFNSQFSPEKRKAYQAYLLDTTQKVLEEYFACFRSCFEKDGKKLYARAEGYLDSLFRHITSETAGIAAAANFFRLVNVASFPDYDVIQDPGEKLLAQGLSVCIDEALLLGRHDITTPRKFTEAVQAAKREYLVGLPGRYAV